MIWKELKRIWKWLYPKTAIPRFFWLWGGPWRIQRAKELLEEASGDADIQKWPVYLQPPES